MRYAAGRALVWTAGLAMVATGALGAQEEPPPAGMGSLRQENLAVRLDARNIQIRVLPLNEFILRLLAPDSYRGHHALRAARDEEILQTAQAYGVAQPVVFLVTVYATAEQAPFNPDQLTITSRGRYFRPIGILPLSPQWDQHRVAQGETASAIYLFEDGVALLEPLIMEYDGIRTDQWSRALPFIEQERARIAARINNQ
jgi:hypothetical protein